RVADKSIYDITSLTIAQEKTFFTALEKSGQLTAREKKIGARIIKEIC
ncbi:hypothetical protein GW814_01555, partial [Candidatus Falkowbacteria bacterium]|nr:hypothetical protein [Candidatus Falkowbacteria bacterium]